MSQNQKEPEVQINPDGKAFNGNYLPLVIAGLFVGAVVVGIIVNVVAG